MSTVKEERNQEGDSFEKNQRECLGEENEINKNLSKIWGIPLYTPNDLMVWIQRS